MSVAFWARGPEFRSVIAPWRRAERERLRSRKVRVRVAGRLLSESVWKPVNDMPSFSNTSGPTNPWVRIVSANGAQNRLAQSRRTGCDRAE